MPKRKTSSPINRHRYVPAIPLPGLIAVAIRFAHATLFAPASQSAVVSPYAHALVTRFEAEEVLTAVVIKYVLVFQYTKGGSNETSHFVL